MNVRSADAADFRGEVHAYFEQCSPAVLRLARRITGNDADAEEVRQEVFLKLQEHLPKLDRTGNVPGWIFRTATTAALKARGRRFRPLQGLGEPVDRSPSPESRDDLEVDLTRVSRALVSLPESPRRILLERFRDGRSPAEIGRRLGLASGNVRVQLFRALQVLRDVLRAMP